MTSTRTYALMEISPEAYAEIADAMKRAQYDHAFMEDNAIDMHGIAVIPAHKTSPLLHRPDVADENPRMVTMPTSMILEDAHERLDVQQVRADLGIDPLWNTAGIGALLPNEDGEQDGDEIDALIDASSFGTEVAKQLRASTPVEVVDSVIARVRANEEHQRKMRAFVDAVFDPTVHTIDEHTILLLGKREVDGYTIEDLAPITTEEVPRFPMRITNTAVDYKQKFEETRALLYDVAMGNNFDVTKLDAILKEMAL